MFGRPSDHLLWVLMFIKLSYTFFEQEKKSDESVSNVLTKRRKLFTNHKSERRKSLGVRPAYRQSHDSVKRFISTNTIWLRLILLVLMSVFVWIDRKSSFEIINLKLRDCLMLTCLLEVLTSLLNRFLYTLDISLPTTTEYQKATCLTISIFIFKVWLQQRFV